MRSSTNSKPVRGVKTGSRGLSMRAYALHRRRLGLPGATHRAVQKAIASGRIVRLPDGSIDPKAADASWASETAPQGSAGNGGASDYQRARALREVYEARLKRLEYERRAGLLVEAAAVADEAFRAARTVRDALQSIPGRVSSVLAAESNPVTVQRILEDEIRSALSILADRLDSTSVQPTPPGAACSAQPEVGP